MKIFPTLIYVHQKISWSCTTKCTSYISMNHTACCVILLYYVQFIYRNYLCTGFSWFKKAKVTGEKPQTYSQYLLNTLSGLWSVVEGWWEHSLYIAIIFKYADFHIITRYWSNNINMQLETNLAEYSWLLISTAKK